MHLNILQIHELLNIAGKQAVAEYRAAEAEYNAITEPQKEMLSKAEAERWARTYCTTIGIYMPRREKKQVYRKVRSHNLKGFYG